MAFENTGRRYNTSKHFHAYVQEGLLESEVAIHEGNEIDPIRKLWVYRPTTYNTSKVPELNN